MGSGASIVDSPNHEEVKPSSLYAVLSNDDLLIEILVRLPAFSILVFKSVSKRWLSLITGPLSSLRCIQNPKVEPPCGFFLQRDKSRFIYDYVPYLVNRSPLLNFGFGFPYDEGNNIEILQSCNGLFLCRIFKLDTPYVYNPSVNRFKMVPPCCIYSEFNSNSSGMRLAFDPIKSPHYKLIFTRKKHAYVHASSIQIQTYSSETGTWSVRRDISPQKLIKYIFFRDAIYWNNAIHWTVGGMTHYRLDLEQLVLTTDKTPGFELDRLRCSKLYESRGCLLFVGEYTGRRLEIYEMMNSGGGWSIKYRLNLDDDIMKPFPMTTGKTRSYCLVSCIVLREKEEDSFLVMETYGKVLQFNFVLNTIRELYDFGPPRQRIPYFLCACYQLYPSFATV